MCSVNGVKGWNYNIGKNCFLLNGNFINCYGLPRLQSETASATTINGRPKNGNQRAIIAWQGRTTGTTHNRLTESDLRQQAIVLEAISPGRVRTDGQAINSRLLYRCIMDGSQAITSRTHQNSQELMMESLDLVSGAHTPNTPDFVTITQVDGTPLPVAQFNKRPWDRKYHGLIF